MKKQATLLILLFGTITVLCQDIQVTFTGTGESTVVDSVRATNLSTNESITLPGNETLVLALKTAVPSIEELTGNGMVFPNPFSGKATFVMSIQKPQTVFLKVQNLVGQVVANTTALAQPGENEFTLSVATSGIYLISLTSDRGTAGYKVICTGTTESENRIQYNGKVGSSDQNPSQSGRQSAQTGYTLGYSAGDIIHYRCKSGVYTTIITDSPTASKNYDVEFVACTDPDGKNYCIVRIGDQTWMVENLAYLPAVSPPSEQSITDKHYYVYDYNGTTISEAKATGNFEYYGVLYNWEAAMAACPAGWYLPSSAEWLDLIDYIGGSGNAGNKMKSTSGWFNNGNGNNSSGFNGLPGGSFSSSSGFNGLVSDAKFWSSSPDGTYNAKGRSLSYNYGVVIMLYAGRMVGCSVRCLKDK
ncbi:MAG: FISUMP domain-containing protein [Bacteroidales bacterium]|jgi:uncharacterized protein (TIGR02145 family)